MPGMVLVYMLHGKFSSSLIDVKISVVLPRVDAACRDSDESRARSVVDRKQELHDAEILKLGLPRGCM